MSEPHLKIWAEERDDPDLRRLARALIDLAIAQSEIDDQAVDTASGDDARAA